MLVVVVKRQSTARVRNRLGKIQENVGEFVCLENRFSSEDEKVKFYWLFA